MKSVGGGSGARCDGDGMDAVHVHLTNTSNLPAEALENEYPLMVDEYALVPDSGGAGQFRGGLGLAWVRAHARSIGGDLTVDRDRPTGAAVRLWLPLVKG